jgi:hypothetical protein
VRKFRGSVGGSRRFWEGRGLRGGKVVGRKIVIRKARGGRGAGRGRAGSQESMVRTG